MTRRTMILVLALGFTVCSVPLHSQETEPPQKAQAKTAAPITRTNWKAEGTQGAVAAGGEGAVAAGSRS